MDSNPPNDRLDQRVFLAMFRAAATGKTRENRAALQFQICFVPLPAQKDEREDLELLQFYCPVFSEVSGERQAVDALVHYKHCLQMMVDRLATVARGALGTKQATRDGNLPGSKQS